MHPESETLCGAIQRATAGMNVDELAWHPEGKWCAAEVLEHLSLTYSGTAKGMRAVLQNNNDPKVRSTTWKEHLAIAVVVGLGYFPRGRQAPKQVMPRDADPEHILEKVHANLCEMDQAIAECEQRFGSKAIILVHPVLGPLTLAQWRKFHRIHCLHHMKQIHVLRRRVKEKTPQPAS